MIEEALPWNVAMPFPRRHRLVSGIKIRLLQVSINECCKNKEVSI
jgi:hypothetical protein